MINVVGAILFTGGVLYAIFGGADFGAGFWDLTAGGAERGRRPRGLIDLSIGRIERTLPGHTSAIVSLAFSADGKRLASGSIDKTARIWDVATGRCERVQAPPPLLALDGPACDRG